MPKFGKVHYNEGYYGDSHIAKGDYKRSIKRVPLGLQVRKQFGKRVIFRVRRGNGYNGSILGKLYQDKYKYVVPSSINNAEGESSRTQFRAAVDYWQNVLSEDEKADYNLRATKGLRMSGYNLFIREAMNGECSMFCDRGDPADYDFTKADFTADGNWHDLDLSAIVAVNAKAVLLRVLITDDLSNSAFAVRKNGQSNTFNQDIRFTKHTNFLRQCTFIVACDANRIIEYMATNTTWTTISMVVRGWWA